MSTETIQPVPSKKTKKKWPWVLLAIVVVLFIIAGLSGQGDAENSPQATPSVSSSREPTPPAASLEPTPEAVPEPAAPAEVNQEFADSVYKAWLASYGVESNIDILLQNPESVQGYLVSAESPVAGTVVFTAQLTEGEVTKDELKQAAMAVLQLVGVENEALERVEIVTADSLVRGVANRRDSPLLNM